MATYVGNTASESEVEFKAGLNSRNMTEISVDGKHLSLEELRKHIKESPTIWKKICALGRYGTDSIKSKCEDKPRILDYLNTNVPAYPNPVEFHVSSVVHVTTEKPFQAILESEKIKPPSREFSWWSLAINQEEIKSAEKLYLQNKKIEMAEPFLNMFTTSPAFHPKSRYGNYRFTFPLTELMELYKEQNCEGEEPVLRVFKTMFYKQEIVYAVLIHSPQDNNRFGDLPLLEDSRFVRYKDGQIIWHAQAISCDHQFTFSEDTIETQLNVRSLWSPTYYVWDNVCLAFHLPFQKALKIPEKRLVEALDACELHMSNLVRSQDPSVFANAKEAVDNLKKEQEINVIA
ncbi:hypothetical protein AOLI_G00127820 [Acnodon oligacanthus]